MSDCLFCRIRDAMGSLLRRNKVPRTEIAILVAEAAESVQALSNAAHGRWVKLLNARCGLRVSHRGDPIKSAKLGVCGPISDGSQ